MLNSIAECDDRIKPTCKEITLTTDSPTLPTVVTTEKMQTQSQPFPKYYVSWHHFEIMPLKEPWRHPLVTHVNQRSLSHGGRCFVDRLGQDFVSGGSPATSWEEVSTSCPQTAAFAAALVTVCTPVALGGIRTLQPCSLQNVNVHQPHTTHRRHGYRTSTHTLYHPYAVTCACIHIYVLIQPNSAVFSW